jgi:hypothetical protein
MLDSGRGPYQIVRLLDPHGAAKAHRLQHDDRPARFFDDIQVRVTLRRRLLRRVPRLDEQDATRMQMPCHVRNRAAHVPLGRHVRNRGAETCDDVEALAKVRSHACRRDGAARRGVSLLLTEASIHRRPGLEPHTWSGIVPSTCRVHMPHPVGNPPWGSVQRPRSGRAVRTRRSRLRRTAGHTDRRCGACPSVRVAAYTMLHLISTLTNWCEATVTS